METKKNLTSTDIKKELLNDLKEQGYKTSSTNQSNSKIDYPNDIKDNDKLKNHYRKKTVQPVLRMFLDIQNPTKKDKDLFQKYINKFFIDKLDINKISDSFDIYRTKDSKVLEQRNKNLKKYQAIK